MGGRRQWLKAALATCMYGAAAQASPLTSFDLYLHQTRQLQALRQQRTGAIKFFLYRQNNQEVLYSLDYDFLSVFNTVTQSDLQNLMELAQAQLASGQKTLAPALQRCLEFCQATNVAQNEAKLEAFRKDRRRGSQFMEFYRSQSGDERNLAIDTFMSTLFPLRQPLDLEAVVAGAEVVILGETHGEWATKAYLGNHLAKLKGQGFRTLALELISADEQDFLDHYQPELRPLLLRRILRKEDALAYANLVEQALREGVRVLGIGDGMQTLPTQGGFITENRNFQLAHHVLDFLRDHPTEKLLVLTGSNHAGFSQNTLEDLRILPRVHPVPDIPTLVKRYLPQRALRTAVFEGNKPSRSVFKTPQGQTFTQRFVENEIAARGAGGEAFMVAFPEVYEDRILTDWERRYDYYLHLPQTS